MIFKENIWFQKKSNADTDTPHFPHVGIQCQYVGQRSAEGSIRDD